MTTRSDINRGIDPEKPEAEGAVDWSVLAVLQAIRKPGAPDILRQVLETYLLSSQPLLESAAAAVSAADGKALMEAAHCLKSSSLAIGATVFGATCFELEIIGRANAMENAPALLPRARSEYESVCSAIQARMKEN